MTGERWERLTELFHAAVALGAEERSAFLAEACAGDAALHAGVERLIAAHERAGGFIEAPALAGVRAWPDEEREPPVASRRFGPYRVVREIGRGGMGAVYLAERVDGEYEQRVAVKLIKRGMDTDVVLQRFRAERQILASLDHPNVARLLDGGTSDDGRPYFVMEYIEGEPIDQYADTRGLSVRDRLRLFLQACSAVSYAHRHRVIHRDIKPVNILVTLDGVPKLLDFGIAKVLEPGADGPTSSLTGFRLLTPEYASPEQVEGRHATAASDVYSLGVVLYELLTGRSPYRLRSHDPLAVAEAVRTADPERPSAAVADADADKKGEGSPRRAGLALNRAAATGSDTTDRLRRRLRGDLDTIVLSALRKEPARRYQSVDELADDIRRHLDGLTVRARADSVRYRAGKWMRRNRSAVVAASLAALVALLAGVGVVTLRATADRRAEPSLVATGVLAPLDRILVADFADRTGDTTLAAAVTDALRADLAQSPLVRVLTPEQVRATLVRMERAPGLGLDDTLAREVAVRNGAKAYVVGSVARVGGAYTISVQLLSADRGEALTADRETAADSSRLIAAVDRASKALRRRVGESLRELRGMPPLEQVTTASLAALRKYSEGYRFYLRNERTEALRLYQEAVALDTGFATAYRAIASAYESLAEPGRSAAALQHAVANQRRLPFLERQFLIAGHAYASGEYQTAINAYADVLERYPNRVPALNNMALAYRNRRRFAVAESLWRRAIELDSTIPALYYGLHGAQAHQGNFVESRRTLELIGRRFPNDPLLETVEVQDAAARQEWDEAERRAEANIAAKQGDTLRLVDAFEQLAGIVMAQGRLPEAERQWRTQLALSAASGSWGRHLFGARQLAYLELRYRNAPGRARALVDSTLVRHPLDSILRGDRPYDELARFYAAAGDLPRARALLAAADSNDRILDRPRRAERSWTRGVIALAEGRLPEADDELRLAAETHMCPICPLPDLARAHEIAGDSTAAVTAYERYVATPWLWRYETDAVELGWALRRVGELNEARGETAKAAEAYARLLQLWRRADGPVARVAAGVRRRLPRRQGKCEAKGS